MSDQSENTAQELADSTPAPVESEKDWRVEAEKWKEYARTWEQRAKENRDALDKLRQMTSAGDSELADLRKRVESAEKRAEELEVKALRAEVAAAKGLTEAQAKRLRGSTREELLADAEDLLAAFGKADEEPEDDRRPPKENLRPGASNEDPADDVSAVAERIMRRKYAPGL